MLHAKGKLSSLNGLVGNHDIIYFYLKATYSHRHAGKIYHERQIKMDADHSTPIDVNVGLTKHTRYSLYDLTDNANILYLPIGRPIL